MAYADNGSNPFLDALKAGGGLNPDGTPTGEDTQAQNIQNYMNQQIDIPKGGMIKDVKAAFTNPLTAMKSGIIDQMASLQDTFDKSIALFHGTAADSASTALSNGFTDAVASTLAPGTDAALAGVGTAAEAATTAEAGLAGATAAGEAAIGTAAATTTGGSLAEIITTALAAL